MASRLKPLYLLWAGIILGVSFIATPAKFLAPDLSLIEALQVGRATFRVLGVVEVLLLATSVVLVVLKSPIGWKTFKWPIAISVVLALQYGVLLPWLGQSTNEILNGVASQSAGSPHWLYVITDVIKISLLFVLALRETSPNLTSIRTEAT